MGRRVLFTALYVSEGAPIGFIWWGLPPRLRLAGMEVDRITAVTAMLVLPWALKFLWAPLIDLLRGPRWGYRAWIGAAQVGMMATLAPLLWLDLVADFRVLWICLLAHAIAAATQDAAVDGLAIRTTTDAERGRLNGWMQAGMLVGRALFSGVALWLREDVGDTVIVAALLVTIGGSLALVLAAGPDRGNEAHGRETSAAGVADRTRAFGSAVATVLRGRNVWLGVGFALVGAAGFEGVGALAGPFMVDRGFSEARIGDFYNANLIMMIAGALLGGYLSDRLGNRRSVMMAVVMIAAVVLLIGLWDGNYAGAGTKGLFGLLVTLYLFIGMFTAASYALFMRLTDPLLGATMFSAFMGVTNLCEAWVAYVGGRLVAAEGYPAAFMVMAGVSLLGIPLVGLMTLREAEADTMPPVKHDEACKD